MHVGLTLALVLVIAACAPVPGTAPTPAGTGSDAHIPPFARYPYQPFSREAAIQIAYREWRAFGQPIVFPRTELPFDNERAEGLWQRVGEYWWLGLPLGEREQGFTGMHDQNGRVFSAAEDSNFAWSAAFIDYVMRMAGAGRRFPYSPTHSDYINAARQNAGSSLPLVRDGRVRGIGITSLQRSPNAPELPTFNESGFPGFEATSWFALMGPAGLPKPIIDKVRAEALKVLADPEMKQKFAALGLDTVGSTPEETHAAIAADIPKWAQVIKDANIKPAN